MDLFETEWDIAFRTGKEAERERIIKLLEEDADNNYYALQLIKGEQK
jgi:hypothetical protein